MNEAKKFDSGKSSITTAPFEVFGDVLKVFDFGAQKYKAKNYSKGDAAFARRCLDAAFRHTFLYGTDELDPESGLPHLHHAIASLMMAVEVMKNTGATRAEVLKAFSNE